MIGAKVVNDQIVAAVVDLSIYTIDKDKVDRFLLQPHSNSLILT